MQRLGHTCRAARALVLSLPEATLQQLAQACIPRAVHACWRAVRTEHLACVQEQLLPAPKVGMRQQLSQWASQAAAVRAGDLQLSCKLEACHWLGTPQLSPCADQMAAWHPCEKRSVLLVPLTGTQHTLPVKLSAQLRSQVLTVPGMVLMQCWSPSGQHLVVVSEEDTSADPQALCISTFAGIQLVGSFLEPLEAEEDGYLDVHILDEAPTMLLTVSSRRGSRVVASTPQGGVLARHPRVLTAASTASVDGGRILRASQAGDRLFIYSATCVQQISLGTEAVENSRIMVSSWGSLASVLLWAYPDWQVWADKCTLLLVDLVRQEVRHSVTLPYDKDCLAQGAHAVAVAGVEQVIVVSSAGKAVGRELFSCPGYGPKWDSLGMFLAVAKDGGGLCVLDGVSGALLVSWPAFRLKRWLRNSSGLATEVDGDWHILRFASGAQPDL